MAHNRGTRRKKRWAGNAQYKGHRKWVGTFDTIEDYKAAYAKTLAELEDEVDNPRKHRMPTVRDFAEAEIHENGRITMVWPEGQICTKATGWRDSTLRRMREGLRPFIRDFQDRLLDDFSRDEAVTWTLPRGANTQQSVRQFFNHARDRGLIQQNHFTRLGASKRKRRVEHPDFEIISDEKYARLRQAAREGCADDYGLVLEGAILGVGEQAMRPGEVFALHWPDLLFDENKIRVRRQIDLDTGAITWPKDDEGRLVVMSPAYRDHLETMPRQGTVINPDMGEILYPAPRGGYMRRSTWSGLWKAICSGAGTPGQDFYELKHRAIQWMVDPIEEGGLGLDPATAALMVGHDDGGYLIATTYTKLAQRRALARAERAMAAYAQRHANTVGAEADTAPPLRLRLVGAN